MTMNPNASHLPKSVLIIGGGAIGCAIAYELVKQGHHVQLIERGQLGQEATFAAAGMLAADAEATLPDAFWELCTLSRSLYPAWIAELEAESHVHCGYRPSGIIRIAADEQDERFLRDKTVWLQESTGWKSPSELIQECPELGPSIRGGIVLEKDHQVDPRALSVALRSVLESRLVPIWEGTECTAILTDASRNIKGVRLKDGRMLEADHVVMAGGAWSLDLLESLGWTLPIFPVQGQLYRLRPKRELTSRIIYTKGCYLVPRSDGTLIVGATQQVSGFQKTCSIEAIQQLHTKAVQLLPELEGAEFLQTWSGLRPGTADGWPILGPLEGYHNLTLACGHFRNGILLTPVTARLVSDWISGHPMRTDWNPFSPNRFEQTAIH